MAYTLSKAGHHVRVLERRDFDVPSGGMRVPPNFSKILRKWIGEEELMEASTRCVGTPFHHRKFPTAPFCQSDTCAAIVRRGLASTCVQSCHTLQRSGGSPPVFSYSRQGAARANERLSRTVGTGDPVGYLHWKPAVMAETGGEFLMMHVSPRANSYMHLEIVVDDELTQRDDLVRSLHKLATGAGARVDFNTEVVSIRQGTANAPSPSVTLATGEVLKADIVIGADGYKSKVRAVVLEEEDCAEPAGMTLYTGVIDAEQMIKDSELRSYALSDEVRLPPQVSVMPSVLNRPSGRSGWVHARAYAVSILRQANPLALLSDRRISLGHPVVGLKYSPAVLRTNP